MGKRKGGPCDGRGAWHLLAPPQMTRWEGRRASSLLKGAALRAWLSGRPAMVVREKVVLVLRLLCVTPAVTVI